MTVLSFVSSVLRMPGSGRSTPQNRSRASSREEGDTPVDFATKLALLEEALVKAGFMASEGPLLARTPRETPGTAIEREH